MLSLLAPPGLDLAARALGGLHPVHALADLAFDLARELGRIARPRDPLGQALFRLQFGWCLERFERLRELCRAHVAIVGMSRQRALADGQHTVGQHRGGAAQGLDVAVADCQQHRELAAAREDALADQHFTE
jgi:hypothetical protein